MSGCTLGQQKSITGRWLDATWSHYGCNKATMEMLYLFCEDWSSQHIPWQWNYLRKPIRTCSHQRCQLSQRHHRNATSIVMRVWSAVVRVCNFWSSVAISDLSGYWKWLNDSPSILVCVEHTVKPPIVGGYGGHHICRKRYIFFENFITEHQFCTGMTTKNALFRRVLSSKYH